MADRVLALLADARAPEHAIDIGCGTGIVTEKLVLLFPEAKITAVDVSPAMIEQARKRIPDTSNVEWAVGDVRNLPAEMPFNLAVSCSSLHWVAPIDDAFRAVAGIVRPGARLAFGMMLKDTLTELHAARQHVAPGKPVGSRLPDADSVLAALETTGWRLLEHQRADLRAEYPSAAAFLQAIHEQGFTGGPVSTSGVPLTRSELKELASHYDSHYKVPTGGVFATYDCLFALTEKT